MNVRKLTISSEYFCIVEQQKAKQKERENVKSNV